MCFQSDEQDAHKKSGRGEAKLYTCAIHTNAAIKVSQRMIGSKTAVLSCPPLMLFATLLLVVNEYMHTLNSHTLRVLNTNSSPRKSMLVMAINTRQLKVATCTRPAMICDKVLLIASRPACLRRTRPM